MRMAFCLMGLWAGTAWAQLVPEIGYVSPAGVRAGTTVDVVLGGYDWTPDMQLFVHDSRIKLELIGPASPVLVPEPPYWFGFKARGPAWPLPREFTARLTIPADVPPGLVRWQVANANGASPPGAIHIGNQPEIRENSNRKSAQVLAALPVLVSGQIRRIEEIDRYQFQVPKAGPITIQLLARQLGSPLHAMVQVRDADGRVVLDAADSEGRDLTLTMIAQADRPYELSLHDLDFAGDRSYVYRLALTAGPRVQAAYPAAGKRGETRSVEFVGIGLATGGPAVESVTRDVSFPVAGVLASGDGGVTSSFAYVLETPWGNALPHTLGLSDHLESVEPPTGESTLAAPGAITGSIESRFGSDRHAVTFKKGESWRVSVQGREIGSPLDLELTILGVDGKSFATSDDVPGTTDAQLSFVAPADGVYQFVVADRSGKSGSRGANYRLSIEPEREEVSLTMPTQLGIPLGTPGKLAVKAVRVGGFKGPIPLAFDRLPEGVTAPADLLIPENMTDLIIDLVCAADAPTNAALCRLTATPRMGEQPVTRLVGTILIATTMKPRIKLTPEGLDDVRKVHRGSTFLAPILIERLEGYAGPITLEMTAKQQRHRQGLASDEFIVVPEAKRIEYPIFVPEWMETTKTSRMILNGSVQVADPKGTVRTLLQRQELRIGILPEGALMKLSHAGGEVSAMLGQELRIPFTLVRAPEFRAPVQIELVSDESQAGLLSATPITATEQREGVLTVRLGSDARLVGEQSLTFRAKGLKDGRWPVIAETTVLVNVRPSP